MLRETQKRRLPPRARRRLIVCTWLAVELLEDRVMPSFLSPGAAAKIAGQLAAPTYLMSASRQSLALPSDSVYSSADGLSPAQLQAAYGVSDSGSYNDNISFNGIPGDGRGQTIAIIDAYDAPHVASDLAVFNSQFGLPQMNSKGGPAFVKVGLDARNNASTTSFPAANSQWALEVDVDVEWAHAIAPQADILLVEAYGSFSSYLLNAVKFANNYSGQFGGSAPSVVSMSWGSSEFAGEGSLDSYFNTPGITYVASSGDHSALLWPASSTHVLAVGGTSLSVNTGSDGTYAYGGETAWSSSGGGLSADVSAPAYQNNLHIYGGYGNGKRAAPDVALDADPGTGVAIYGTDGAGGWTKIGGTSIAAPQWAALVAIADQGLAAAGAGSLSGFSQTLPELYQLAGDFHDVTSGGNGAYPAGPGFDLVTGWGTPVANALIPDLVAETAAHTAAPAVSTASYTAIANTTLSVAAPGVLANDTAPNGATLSAILVTGPANGQLTLNSDGSFTYTPNVDFVGTDRFTYQASDGTLSSSVATVTITVASAAPSVTSVLVNGSAAAQRSMVTSLMVNFNVPVVLAANAFSLSLHPNVTLRGVAGQTVGSLPAMLNVSPASGLSTSFTITFSDPSNVVGSIADGVYDLTINAASVQNGKQTMAANAVATFYRLFGDTLGHQRVNLTDYSTFAGAYGTRSADAAFVAYLDANADGVINLTDYSAFVGNYGTVYSGFSQSLSVGSNANPSVASSASGTTAPAAPTKSLAASATPVTETPSAPPTEKAGAIAGGAASQAVSPPTSAGSDNESTENVAAAAGATEANAGTVADVHVVIDISSADTPALLGLMEHAGSANSQINTLGSASAGIVPSAPPVVAAFSSGPGYVLASATTDGDETMAAERPENNTPAADSVTAFFRLHDISSKDERGFPSTLDSLADHANDLDFSFPEYNPRNP
jgi:hypothetical protein